MSLNVTYKAFDRHSLDERQKLTPLFWEYWFRVNKQDLSNMVEVELQGETQTITSAEMMIFWYLYRGFDFQLCLVDGGIAGFLIYHVVCTHVLEVRGIFVESKFWNSGFGQGLVLSLPTDI